MRYLLISTVLCPGLATGASAQGVLTVDTQNIAQEIRQLQQMLEGFGIQSDIFENALEQLDMLQQQFDQLQTTYASLAGPREILGLLMGGELDQLLDAKFEDIPGLIRGIQQGDWSNLLGVTAGPMRTQMQAALASAGFRCRISPSSTSSTVCGETPPSLMAADFRSADFMTASRLPFATCMANPFEIPHAVEPRCDVPGSIFDCFDGQNTHPSINEDSIR